MYTIYEGTYVQRTFVGPTEIDNPRVFIHISENTCSCSCTRTYESTKVRKYESTKVLSKVPSKVPSYTTTYMTLHVHVYGSTEV
jgi:hypothetical protein